VASWLQVSQGFLGQYAIKMKFNYTAFYGYILVLTVGDDELSLGDNKDTSSEAAKGQGTCT